MRPSRILGLIAWVVSTGCFVALLFSGLQTFRIRMETGDSFPEYSTYRADPKGLKALYDSLQATDLLHVSRRLQSSKILPSGENQVFSQTRRSFQPRILSFSIIGWQPVVG